MNFIFMLVICLLSLPTLFNDKYYSLEEVIYNTYKHYDIFIINSIRISFPKTPALHISCLGLCTHNKLYTKSGCNPSFKLSIIILLLAGDVSINPGPKTFQNMRFATENLRSVRHKSAAISDLMLCKDIDILALTETMISASDVSACLAVICSYGFCLYHPIIQVGGGVAFLVPETYKVEIIHTPQYQRFEVMHILIKHLYISAILYASTALLQAQIIC